MFNAIWDIHSNTSFLEELIIPHFYPTTVYREYLPTIYRDTLTTTTAKEANHTSLRTILYADSTIVLFFKSNDLFK